MIYLPSDLLNSNYNYYLSDNYIIIENNGTCQNVYFRDDYYVTNEYICSDISSPGLSFDKFTDNYFYRLDLPNIIFLVIVFILVLCVIFNLLFKSLFRRF